MGLIGGQLPEQQLRHGLGLQPESYHPSCGLNPHGVRMRGEEPKMAAVSPPHVPEQHNPGLAAAQHFEIIFFPLCLQLSKQLSYPWILFTTFCSQLCRTPGLFSKSFTSVGVSGRSSHPQGCQ